MSDIPLEVKAQIQTFKNEEAQKAVERASEGESRPRKKDLRENAYRRQMTAKDIVDLARPRGITLETGRGRHCCHLIAPDGSSRPLPVHPGNLATGTCCSLVAWIKQFPIEK